MVALLVASAGATGAVTRGRSGGPVPSTAQPPPAQAFADAADRYPASPPHSPSTAPSPPVSVAAVTSPPTRPVSRPGPGPSSGASGASRAPATAAVVGFAASRPVWIDIRSIGASAAIDPLGLNADGSLAVPTDFSRAGYYTGLSTPGEIGPAIIVAHVDSKRGPAVFVHLSGLQPGAEAVVTRADGSRLAFIIDRVERHPKNAFPTEEVYGPTPGPTLRLITCGGSFDHASGHYRDNDIAFAHLRGPA